MDEKLMADRKATHGEYSQYAQHEQALRELLRSTPTWPDMTQVQRSVLDNMVGKLARILTGSPDHVDHWRDLQGYAQRAIDELLTTPGATDTKTTHVSYRGGIWQ